MRELQLHFLQNETQNPDTKRSSKYFEILRSSIMWQTKLKIKIKFRKCRNADQKRQRFQTSEQLFGIFFFRRDPN
jgi:hypothetical protein